MLLIFYKWPIHVIHELLWLIAPWQLKVIWKMAILGQNVQENNETDFWKYCN